MPRFLLSAWLLFLAPILLCGQSKPKMIKVSGEIPYYVPESESQSYARQKALENAKIKLIEQEFGVSLEMSSATSLSTTTGAETQSLIQSHVKGEWIETIGTPNYRFGIVQETGQMVIWVKLKGVIRELSQSKVDFEALTLRLYPEKKASNTEFINGDDFYLYFQTPVDGYLAVYLYDGKEDVYCLLPYQNETSSIRQVNANIPYVFFSQEKSSGEPKWVVDEYQLTCDNAVEINRLYVVFSTKNFTKALDQAGDNERVPRNLKLEDFNKWLGRLKSQDASLSIKEISLTINKNKS